MPRPRFEQYKDALRRGHAAILAGHLEDAVEAYTRAARIVPDRALPHTSAAAALVKLGRRDEALEALGRAAQVAPDDEPTLRARAGVLHEIGRDADAAAALERLATIVRDAGRRDEGLRLARRSLELTPNDARRRLVAAIEAGDGSAPPEAAAGGGGPAWPAIDLPSRPPQPPSDPSLDPEELVAAAVEEIAGGSLAEAREHLLEELSHYDDELLEMILEEQEIPKDRLVAAIRKATLEIKLTPVLCGSSFKNKGVQPLLDAVIDFLPSPLDVPPVSGHEPVKGEEDREAVRQASDGRADPGRRRDTRASA